MATHEHNSTHGEPEIARNDEEEALLVTYRDLARWEKNAFFLLLQSVAWGPLESKETDSMSWDAMRRTLGLPKVGKQVSHG